MNPFTKIMNGNKSYTATFTINTYTLSTSVVGSGSVTRNPSQATYDHGTSVQVTAVPGFGYNFTAWSGDTTGTMNPFTKIMNGNKSYTATFAINTYTLSTSVVGSGSVTRNPSQATYNHGTSVQVTAVPGTGYSFTGWSGDTTGTNNPFTVILHENKSYTATFAINTYTLSTSVVGSGSVTRNPSQATYNHGTSVQITAVPGTGYSFASWSGDTTGTMNPFTKIMNGNKSYTATFAINTYTLSTSVVGNGAVFKSPDQPTYNHGTSVQLTASAGFGYSFSAWSGDTTGTMNPFTKIMNGNKSYTATFAINTYTLSTSVVGSGSVTRNPSQATYNHGTSVQVTAVPGTGYSFTGWSGDTTGTNNPFTVILHENKSYTATFAINTYTLSTSVVGSGSVTRNPSQATYDHGTSVQVTAVPGSGYSFSSWSGDTTGTMNPFTKIMNGNKSYTATFTINGYTLSTSVVGNGAVLKNPDQPTYNHGTSVQLTASAGLGYSFSAWSGDTTGTMNPFTKIMNGNKSYTATFTLNTYTLSTSVVGSGSVTRNPSQATYNHGTSVQVTAVPGTGYHFTSWSGDTTGTMNPFTKIMNGNKSYTATFDINTYTLSTSVVGNGAVFKSPDQPTYNHGTSVQLTASAGFGYSFSAWSGDTTGTMNPFTKIMNGNKSYTATFTLNTYTLSTSVVGSGSVNRNPSQATYNHGTSVQVTAVPGTGYSFTGWSGDTTGTNNPFTVILHENKSYTATFTINTYTLSTSVVGSGSVNRNPSQATYNHGTSVQVTAVPGTGYSFSAWSGDTTGTMNPFTKIMNGNKSYTATFTINSYTLTVNTVGSGSVSKNPDQPSYNHGTSVQLTATPGAFYSFTGWSGDTTGTMNPFTKIMNGNRSYTATFTINSYTLTVNTVGLGSVTKNPDQPTYNHGTSVQLTAVPAIGYAFTAWSGDTTGTMNPFTKIMNGNKSYTATFTINSYTLTINIVGGGTVLRNPDQPTYTHGTSVQMTAVPAVGYTFGSWSGDASGSANPRNISMNGNKIVTATFIINTYTLSTSVTPAGTGSVTRNPSQANYNHGTSVLVTAVPSTGYSLAAWSGDTTGTVNPFTVVMNGNKSYTATFAINVYTLTVNTVGSGSVNRNPNQATYNHGTSVQLTAVPGTGYSFSAWSGDTTGTMNPFTKIMNGNKSYTATFTINTYTLTTFVTGNGAVFKSPDQPTYNHGTSVQLTASAGFGYSFSAWSGDTTGTMNPFTKIMNGNKSYTATFTINTYTISTSVVGSGSVNRNPSQANYNHGTSVLVTAVPGSGYSFSAWSGDTTGTNNPFTVILHESKSYTATFVINAYTLTVNIVGNGSVARNPNQPTYNHGTSVQLTANPGTGYTFSAWSGDTTGTMNPFTKIMNGNKTYTATFTINVYTLTTFVTGNGAVFKTPDQPTYNHGTAVQLNASAGFGYSFSAWSGDTTGTMNPFTKIMNGNKSYTATFTLNVYTLSVTTVGSGSVAKNPNQPTYNHGTSVVLTATPAVGYSFTAWSGDTTGTVNPFTKIMNGNKSYTATFTINSYTLTIVIDGNGAVVKVPDQPTYTHGSTVQITANPAAAHTFMGWSGDATGLTNPLNVVMNRNKTITATFSINMYSLTVNLIGSGLVEQEPTTQTGTYAHGTLVQLTADPAHQYRFRMWSGDASGPDNPTSVMMTGPKVVNAHFDPIAAPVKLPERFLIQAKAAGLSYPAGMAFLPDGRLLFVELYSGNIRMIVNSMLSTVDPAGVVDSVAITGGEQGLFGIAVDPDWPSRPYIYLHYTALGGTIRISRMTAQGDLTDGASNNLHILANSRRDILRGLPNQNPIHNGGTLRFGPDGMLYVSLGDDSNQCTAQDSTQLSGVLLRLNITGVANGAGPPPSRASLAAPGNPLLTHPNPDMRLVWAMGLRNPFRFSIDPANGELFVADVGDIQYEEIDRVTGPGMNFGWPHFEGPAAHINQCNSLANGVVVTAPIYAYDRTGFTASVVSGGVYRSTGCASCDFPLEYEGDYFYSDHYAGFLRRLKFNGTSWGPAPAVPGQPNPTDWGTGFDEVSDFLIGPDGALWYCRMSIDYADLTGEIGRIFYVPVPTGVETPAPSVLSFALPYPSPSHGTVTFSYTLPSPGRVELQIFDAMGRVSRNVVESADLGAGRHTATWDGRTDRGEPAASGIYLARLMVNGRAIIRRVVMTR